MGKDGVARDRKVGVIVPLRKKGKGKRIEDYKRT